LKLLDGSPNGSGQQIVFKLKTTEVEFETPLSGPQNAANLLVAAAVGEELGITEIGSALSQFSGVLRRQTDHGLFGGARLIEDFAHHPTAVALTLQGIKESHPGKRLIVAFEPRSNTTRRGFFQDEYPKSLSKADVVLLPEQKEGTQIYSQTDVTTTPLNVSKMAERIQALGKEAHSFSDVSSLASWIINNRTTKDVVICMSNGDFGGLIELLRR
jgi:UDP-N-acetylmuramate: L-alanyl-gamma-D-glutamyl-meso-diaminopimelate ligase